jgi:PKD repeat protein
VLHPFADDGTYPITLAVSDGFATGTDNATAVVLNVAPTVDIGDDAEIDEGDTFEREGSFEDPGADSWVATVNYGDGSGVQSLSLATDKTFDLSHTYVDDGIYTITVTVTDDDGGVGMDDLTVTVLNVPPIVDAGPDAEVLTGENYDFYGTFEDPGVEDYPWTWVIDWDDGQTDVGTTNDQDAPITATHRVCTAGDYTVTLTVTDKDGGVGSDALILTVPFLMVDIVVEPGENANPLNLKRGGVGPVAIFSTLDFDASEIDPASLRMGDVDSPSIPAAVRGNGAIQAELEDVDGDGLLDLVVQFPIPDLVASGEVDEYTTEVSVEGYLYDACTNIKGVGHVSIRPM